MPEARLRRFDAAALGGGFRHEVIAASDVKLHVVRGGKGDPLVLLAGWPQSWYAWRKVMPHLAARYEVAAIDLPGMGDSERPSDGYDVATMARRVHEAIEALGFAGVRLVTHDIGTWLAFPYAHEYAATLRKVVFMDAVIPGLFAAPPDPKLWHFGFNQQRGLAEALTAGRERVFLEWFFRNRTLVTDAISAADLDEYERVYSAPGAMQAGFEYYRAMPLSIQQNQAYAAHGKLKVPAAVFGSDTPIGPVMTAAMKQLCDDIVAEIVPGSGHYIPEEQPQWLIGKLSEFLAGC
jgi:pimeloyl-ACP methyl ester carboxylesterase